MSSSPPDSPSKHTRSKKRLTNEEEDAPALQSPVKKRKTVVRDSKALPLADRDDITIWEEEDAVIIGTF
jgi:hypothetical protein